MADTWITQKSPYYQKMTPVWSSIMAHYEASPGTLKGPAFIKQRYQGESDRQFQERMETSDYPPLFATVVDEYLGRFSANEAQTARIWQEEGTADGLGDVDEPGTPAYRLWNNLDGRGGNWTTTIEDAAVLLLTVKEVWGIAEGVVRDGDGNVIGGSRARIIEPWAVYDVLEDANGNPIEVKVAHKVDARTSIMEEPKPRQRFTIYRTDGYEVYEADDKGEEYQVKPFTPYGGEDGTPFVYRIDGRPVLPLWRTELSLRRCPGEILADRNNAIFNQESQRDNILRIGNTPTRVIVTDDLESFTKLIKEGGGNTLQLHPEAKNQHYYMAPQPESAQIATEVLTKKVESFFASAFRSYENSVRGRQKTATEVDSESAAGRGFLSVLATAIDEFEMNMARRLEQIENPDRPDAWGQFYVTRNKSFKPIDEQESAERLTRRYFDGPVPVGPSGRASAAMKIADADGLEYTEDEVTAEVNAAGVASGQSAAVEAELNALLNA